MYGIYVQAESEGITENPSYDMIKEWTLGHGGGSGEQLRRKDEEWEWQWEREYDVGGSKWVKGLGKGTWERGRACVEMVRIKNSVTEMMPR